MTETRVPLHDDRLLPADPGVRTLARNLHQQVGHLPIVSLHGHVPAGLLLDDQPFADPTSLLVTPDHYVTRLLHASGVPLDALGVGRGPLSEDEAHAAWRAVCAHWDVFRGTSVRVWLDAILQEVFGTDLQPSTATADELYDHLADRLRRPEFRPRALVRRFRIDALATTDDPADDLAAHAALRDDPAFGTRVVPTFRPDRYLEVAAPGWADTVETLGAAARCDAGSYRGWVAAMEDRRTYFSSHGAVSTDQSHEDVGTTPLDGADAEHIYARALAGTASPEETAALRRHMLLEMARMSTDDGLTMTLHPGVRRGHHRPTLERFGPDTGHDIPLPGAFTDALRPLLERFGTHPNLRLVLFTLDESVFSRELAPLAGFYPSVYVGAPWWFLDAPASIRRWRESVTEIAGLSRTSGFIDDTRALCSIPARHDMARRLDAGFLAGLVAEHRLHEEEAAERSSTWSWDGRERSSVCDPVGRERCSGARGQPAAPGARAPPRPGCAAPRVRPGLLRPVGRDEGGPMAPTTYPGFTPDGLAAVHAGADRPLLLTNATVHTLDPLIGRLHGADVLLGGGLVVGVGPGIVTAAEDDGAVVIDATGTTVLPSHLDVLAALGRTPRGTGAGTLAPGADAGLVVIPDEHAASLPVALHTAFARPELVLAVLDAGRPVHWAGIPGAAPRRAGLEPDQLAVDPDRVGMWVDTADFLHQELTADGRYDETRGGRPHAFQGRYWVAGDRVDYLDDLGFWAFGRFDGDALHHAGYTMHREEITR